MGRWEYPRSRRIMMQVTLCVIFAASVALAAVVTRQHRLGGESVLSARSEFGQFRFQSPAGWVLKRKGSGALQFVLQEPDRPGKQGRTLTGRGQQLPAPIPAAEFLQSGDVLDDSTRIIATDSQSEGFEPITMAGVPGVEVGIQRKDGEVLQTQWIACCVRPSGLAITLVMDCPQTDDPDADRQLLRDIAGTIEPGN